MKSISNQVYHFIGGSWLVEEINGIKIGQKRSTLDTVLKKRELHRSRLLTFSKGGVSCATFNNHSACSYNTTQLTLPSSFK